MKTNAEKDRGFTLLEVLVVLVITSLISVVLIQGFGLVLSARTSVQEKIIGLDQSVLRQNIFSEPLRGILPDYPERPDVFNGTSNRLKGLTIHPLQSRTGAPVGFSMSLEYDSRSDQTQLIYEEKGLEPQILGRWDGAEGAFRYRDRKGPWRDTWMPSPNTPQTPWSIRLDMGAEFPSTLIVGVNGPHQRIMRFQDLPFGSSSPR